MNNPIFALSTEGGTVTYGVGAVENDEVIFLKFETINGLFRSWKTKAKAKLEEAHSKGMQIIVEDRLGLFPEYLSVNLGDVDPIDNRTYQHIALDQYMGLASMGASSTFKQGGESTSVLGALVFNDKTWPKAMKPDSQGINIDYDEKGRAKYDLEKNLTGEQRCLLLITLSAGGISVRDGKFADALFGALEDEYANHEEESYTSPPALRSLMRRTQEVVDVEELMVSNHG